MSLHAKVAPNMSSAITYYFFTNTKKPEKCIPDKMPYPTFLNQVKLHNSTQ